jgi:ketosteroid isomerase-like protein
MGEATSIQLQMFRTIEAHDLDGLRALYDPGYSYTGTDGVEVKDPEAGVEIARTYITAFPDLRFEVLTQHEVGDTAIAEFRVGGTHKEELEGIPATGREVLIEACNIMHVRYGKIVREREYYDTLEMLMQIGVFEA